MKFRTCVFYGFTENKKPNANIWIRDRSQIFFFHVIGFSDFSEFFFVCFFSTSFKSKYDLLRIWLDHDVKCVPYFNRNPFHSVKYQVTVVLRLTKHATFFDNFEFVVLFEKICGKTSKQNISCVFLSNFCLTVLLFDGYSNWIFLNTFETFILKCWNLLRKAISLPKQCIPRVISRYNFFFTCRNSF